jgi:DNA-binding response OmpR family regulator
VPSGGGLITLVDRCSFYVLDDDPVILDLMVKLLEMSGHSVSYSSDSVNAATEINAIKPDCLITDLVMPDRDGLDVVESLCEYGALSSMTIIMVTTRTKDMWRQMAQDKGVHGFIPKPIDPETFVGLVEEIISARSG